MACEAAERRPLGRGWGVGERKAVQAHDRRRANGQVELVDGRVGSKP